MGMLAQCPGIRNKCTRNFCLLLSWNINTDKVNFSSGGFCIRAQEDVNPQNPHENRESSKSLFTIGLVSTGLSSHFLPYTAADSFYARRRAEMRARVPSAHFGVHAGFRMSVGGCFVMSVDVEFDGKLRDSGGSNGRVKGNKKEGKTPITAFYCFRRQKVDMNNYEDFYKLLHSLKLVYKPGKFGREKVFKLLTVDTATSLKFVTFEPALSIKNGKDVLPIEDNRLEEERSDDSNCLRSRLGVWGARRSSLISPENATKTLKNFFKNWCNKKGVNTDEKSLLAYFVIRNEKLKAPGSLWAEYSMLKSTIFLHESIDISKFSMLIAFLKKKNVGYQPKKASVLLWKRLQTPDDKFLVGMIFGVAGACRREELYNLKIEDIEESDRIMIVKLPQTMTHIQRSFVIINEPNEKVDHMDIYHKYLNLRPRKGTIGRWPSKIAEYLSLKNPAAYTGHSFRRTSATLLVNKGEDILGLKRDGGWKSSSTAGGYIEDSIENKIKFSKKKILHSDKKKEVLKPSTSMSDQENKENSMWGNTDIGASLLMSSQ
ncbi:hypothetical protein NQ315_015352 [Exocentrus adspersus]|uniref:Tyr recombinase domain-containing protein n=1 Tax=Exocentrus adspersus TaxID=1586481 RepID=A0AAV8VKY2_9CUCU|nr:hypothetical protein NQ315_015352 [Exocentrus adspersus]